MRWSERQQAMLREMGVRLWLPDAVAAVEVEPEDATVEVEPEDATAEVFGPAPARLRSTAGDPGAVAARLTDGLDWSALADHAAACTACGLCAGRTRSVFGAGQREADWFVVGDAPDEDDDRAGAPFAGRAGRLLDNMLGALRLTRGTAPRASRVYVTQSVKCQPPGRRAPEPSEIACCEPYLARQLQLVQPRIVLAMGRVAAQALLHSTEPIGRLRGRVHRYRGLPLVVTAAPAHLLRHPQGKADAWEDLCLAQETVTDCASI